MQTTKRPTLFSGTLTSPTHTEHRQTAVIKNWINNSSPCKVEVPRELRKSCERIEELMWTQAYHSVKDDMDYSGYLRWQAWMNLNNNGAIWMDRQRYT